MVGMNSLSPDPSDAAASAISSRSPHQGATSTPKTDTESVRDLSFVPDQLGDGYTMTHVELGDDPDGETPIRFTLVRHMPENSSESATAAFYDRPALLFVHGMTDYFFHTHVAEYFYRAGYAVYGIDMRKCGRSWREGQTWHHVTDQAFYDEDISRAVDLIGRAHPQGVVVSGHSTGGLDVTMWCARLNPAHEGRRTAETFHHVRAIVLNSPWFGLQFDASTQFIINRIFPIVAKTRPKQFLTGGINRSYGQSLHASQFGEWNYNLELKPLEPRPKYVSWLVGVAKQIKALHSGDYSTGKPTLLLCSTTHHFAKTLSEDTYTADAILRPSDMRRWAHHANPDITVVNLDGAMHDVFLSREPVRTRAMDETAQWLEDVLRPASGS